MSKQHARWRPAVCPITGRPFFMWIEHHETRQMVPTYGGPFDSYTIPEKDSDGEYCCERYDHDRGGWLGGEYVGVQIVSDQLYTSTDDPAEIMQQRDQLQAALWATVEQRDRLLAAATKVIAFRVGDLPTLGYLRDTGRSRDAIGELASAISSIERTTESEGEKE